MICRITGFIHVRRIFIQRRRCTDGLGLRRIQFGLPVPDLVSGGLIVLLSFGNGGIDFFQRRFFLFQFLGKGVHRFFLGLHGILGSVPGLCHLFQPVRGGLIFFLKLLHSLRMNILLFAQNGKTVSYLFIILLCMR